MISPYHLLQETHQNNPWKLLICCILLNNTTSKQVHKIIDQLFEKYPTPTQMTIADTSELIEIIKPCGFYNIRAKKLKQFSQEYVTKDWKLPIELYGIGEYANDSYRIFVLKENYEPKDKELKKYIEWLNTQNS